MTFDPAALRLEKNQGDFVQNEGIANIIETKSNQSNFTNELDEANRHLKPSLV